MSNILESLNPEQKKAAMTIEGPLLILAGAGSGKTKTITQRIAHMINDLGIDHTEILAVTFTNKAAAEMRERIALLVGEKAKYMTVATFHSFGARLLRSYSEEIGYGSNFNIYDSGDQNKILKNIMKNYDAENDMFKPKKVISKISNLKEQDISPNEYVKMASSFYEKTIAEVYEKYQIELKKNNAMDFSDILVNTKLLLEKKDILDKVQKRYKYITIDEYQDTNKIQYDIVNKIVEKHKNLCVVGDEDQSIYGFRGADIRNILNFENDYKNAKVIKLEKNYRSTETILGAANELIKNNTTSKGKKLWTDSGEGAKIKLFEGEDAREEASYVVKEIKKLSEDKFSYKDFCILYRTNAQSRAFENEFKISGVPYKIFGGMQFYQRKEIKDILSFFSLINNIEDNISFMRIVDFFCQGVGEKTIEKLEEYGIENNISLYEVLCDIDNVKGVTGKGKLSLISLRDIIEKGIELSKENGLSKIFDMILAETKYVDKLKLQQEDDKILNIYELKNSIHDIEKTNENITLSEYVENISLVSVVDDLDEDTNYVKMMTIHNSKGLEFPVVFIVGMEDELFPGKSHNMDDYKIEEERRLCYVAITRAEKRLYLTHARSRVLYNTMSNMREPSRFIYEIPSNYFETEKIYMDMRGYRNNSVKNFSDFKSPVENKKDTIPDDYMYQVGQYLTHKKFGEGKVKHIEIDKDKIKIFFPGFGEKEFKSSVLNKFLV
ncbi:MAG: UvrD-helicase domain-containing protein [Fusobacteria bacterium]|nr:UvrD-helicase domain-containing protein [Fusobacteriota bacterium]